MKTTPFLLALPLIAAGWSAAARATTCVLTRIDAGLHLGDPQRRLELGRIAVPQDLSYLSRHFAGEFQAADGSDYVYQAQLSINAGSLYSATLDVNRKARVGERQRTHTSSVRNLRPPFELLSILDNEALRADSIPPQSQIEMVCR